MNKILPKIRKESIFARIKKMFKIIFKIEEIEEIPKEIKIARNNITKKETKKSDYIEDIEVKDKDEIFLLQKRLKEGSIEISDLTNEELDEMIELYKIQIQEKKDKLKYYRRKIIKNKKENQNGIL